MWQAMCGIPGVRKGRQTTSDNLRNMHQVFPIDFVCHVMLVKSPATNSGIGTQRSQVCEKSASKDSQHCTTSSTISLTDPQKTAEKEFELHHRTNLSKSVSKYQGNCGRPIKVEEVMVVRSYGRINSTDKSAGKEKTKFDLLYIHLNDDCLENYIHLLYIYLLYIYIYFSTCCWLIFSVLALGADPGLIRGCCKILLKKVDHRNDIICRKIIDSTKSKKLQF